MATAGWLDQDQEQDHEKRQERSPVSRQGPNVGGSKSDSSSKRDDEHDAEDEKGILGDLTPQVAEVALHDEAEKQQDQERSLDRVGEDQEIAYFE
jgi:hypothetical protein